MERVKFYSLSDLSISYHIDRLKRIIEISEPLETDSLLDVLEFYNVLKFINNKVYPSFFSETNVKKAKNRFNKIISIFFNKLSKEYILQSFQYFFFSGELEENILKKSEIKDLDKHSHTLFRQDFLECFEKYNLDEKISENDLYECIEAYSIPIFYFLDSQYYINKFPLLMKKIFLGNPSNFELLLNNYSENGSNYFIPTNITKDEMYQFCEIYLESRDANLNYVYLIWQGIQGIKELTIDAKLKLKAKKRSVELEEEIFNQEKGLISKGTKYSFAVYTEKESYDNSNANFKSFIDLKYLEKENYPENLLEEMMYFDYFYTDNWILNLCSFPNLECSTFSRTLSGIHTKKHYETSPYFTNKNYLILLTFKLYQEKIKEISNSRIEELLAYFFSNYSKENFEIDWLPLDFADETQKINIQIKNLVTLEEQIRKQWKLYCEENEIDKDLFVLESTPRVAELKSLLNKKYIYAKKENNNVNLIMHLLFCDQSDLIYINENLQAKNFVQLVTNNKIKKEDFHNYQQSHIDFLIDNKIICINELGNLYIPRNQMMRIPIFFNIYKYGVIHYYHWNKKLTFKNVLNLHQKEIDKMIEEGLLVSENTLFARPEVEYLNYILNNSTFDNSLGLRNKYSHGSVVEESNEDYLRILIILVVYVIKINEELTIRENN